MYIKNQSTIFMLLFLSHVTVISFWLSNYFILNIEKIHRKIVLYKRKKCIKLRNLEIFYDI